MTQEFFKYEHTNRRCTIHPRELEAGLRMAANLKSTVIQIGECDPAQRFPTCSLDLTPLSPYRFGITSLTLGDNVQARGLEVLYRMDSLVDLTLNDDGENFDYSPLGRLRGLTVRYGRTLRGVDLLRNLGELRLEDWDGDVLCEEVAGVRAKSLRVNGVALVNLDVLRRNRTISELSLGALPSLKAGAAICLPKNMRQLIINGAAWSTISQLSGDVRELDIESEVESLDFIGRFKHLQSLSLSGVCIDGKMDPIDHPRLRLVHVDPIYPHYTYGGEPIERTEDLQTLVDDRFGDPEEKSSAGAAHSHASACG